MKPKVPHGHHKAERRNHHLHRAALAKLREEPERKTAALELLERWLADERLESSRPWLLEWRALLTERTIDDIAAIVLSEEGQALRQCSPLGPLLTPQERWKALAEVNAALRDGERGSP